MISLGLLHCGETGGRVDGKTYCKFDMEYDAIIKTAYEENPLLETPAEKRGSKKKSKV